MDTIREIKRIITIEQLIAKAGLQINNSGFVSSIYKDEKTPSMKINVKDNYYWCFATNQGGDVIQFYQDFYKVDTSTAIKELAQLAGIDTSNYIERRNLEGPENKSFGELNFEREQLFECLSDYEKELYEEKQYKNGSLDEYEAHKSIIKDIQRERLYTNRLIFDEIFNYTHTNWCKEGYDYLYNQRKLSPETVTKFKICVINNYYSLNNHLKKKFKIDDLTRAGLYSQKGNLIFYKHRILIPYLHKNRIVYMRGRYFDENNNPKTDSYKYLGLKNDMLDLNRSKRFFNSDIIRELNPGERLYITEGEFDTMILSGWGYNSIAIAGAGNIPNEKYFIPLLDFDIILCVDTDEAGERLRDNLVKIFSKFGKEIKQKELPTKDVNEFAVNNVKKQ